MEKLIELLNEYEKLNMCRKFDSFELHTFEDSKWLVDRILEDTVISRRYGFIKWLVDNDKIDLDKVEKKFYNEICITDYWDKDRIYWEADLVIAVLSISDTPIEDLISYLQS